MHAIKNSRLGSALGAGNHKLFIYGINAVLLIAIAAHAGLRVQDLFFTPDRIAAPQQQKIEIVRPKENFSLLPSLHLFGKAKDDAPGAVVQQEIVAPDTKLALTLRGIFARRDRHTGIAIINDDRGNDEKYFAVGAEVFGQATLKEIYDDRVILERNGKFETLRLPKEFLLREHFTNKALMAKRKEIATDYRKRFLSRDGMDLIKLFGFEPAYKNGGFIGFIIKALGDEGREMMEILGLMDGDMVTVINGMRLSESLEAFDEIKKLKTATSIDVIIERDGIEIPFHFELEAPAEGEELDAYRQEENYEDLSGDDLSRIDDDEERIADLDDPDRKRAIPDTPPAAGPQDGPASPDAVPRDTPPDIPDDNPPDVPDEPTPQDPDRFPEEPGLGCDYPCTPEQEQYIKDLLENSPNANNKGGDSDNPH